MFRFIGTGWWYYEYETQQQKNIQQKRVNAQTERAKKQLHLCRSFFWQQVKGRQLEGRKFRRQISIGNYIVDFYCPEEKLVVELDGEVHFDEEAIKYDKRRTEFLESVGLKVIRFENQDVLKNTEYVLCKIKECFKKHT